MTPSPVDPHRLAALNPSASPDHPGPVLYWMSRDQRAHDNWALIHAQNEAIRRGVPLAVVFCLAERFPGATLRHYDFMLAGLRRLQVELERYAIPLILRTGRPPEEIAACADRLRAGLVVTDFDPLRIKREWRGDAARRLAVRLVEVDAHNIVPCRIASPKREYGAYTLRPKIRRLLPEFLVEFPPLLRHPHPWRKRPIAPDWRGAARAVKADAAVAPVPGVESGEAAAAAGLRRFVEERLHDYASASADPTVEGQSGLSPYLHFGQISAQRVALTVMRADSAAASRDAFLEQLIVRRELADNFCWYCAGYDDPGCFPPWAAATLARHANDPRPYRYSAAELERAMTHDPLWNAAQRQAALTGTMHGYLRMYWAKKILEWSPTPEQAMREAIRLNDRHQLDGRDPNGYTGIAWSVGGVHDRPWGERPVFGMVRYMNAAGCARKFDTASYIRRFADPL